MTAQLGELLTAAGIDLPAEPLRQLAWLGDELLRWNRMRNLTAITDPAEVAEKHLVDSLTILPWLGTARRLLDLGSGAGFPALPVKIARPDLAVVSLDAVAKKIAFQRHVARALNLQDFTAVHGRAEAWVRQPEAGRFDLVTARAMTSLRELFALAVPYLEADGRLLAMKGPEGADELQVLTPQLAAAGWQGACHAIRLPGTGARRCLIVLKRSV